MSPLLSLVLCAVSTVTSFNTTRRVFFPLIVAVGMLRVVWHFSGIRRRTVCCVRSCHIILSSWLSLFNERL